MSFFLFIVGCWWLFNYKSSTTYQRIYGRQLCTYWSSPWWCWFTVQQFRLWNSSNLTFLPGGLGHLCCHFWCFMYYIVYLLLFCNIVFNEYSGATPYLECRNSRSCANSREYNNQQWKKGWLRNGFMLFLLILMALILFLIALGKSY